MAEHGKTRVVVLAQWPEGMPDTEKDFRVEPRDVPAVTEGHALLKTLYLSVDPYMRDRMRNRTGSYLPSFKIGEPIEGYGIARVISSKNADFPEGTLVVGRIPWAELVVLDLRAQPLSVNKLTPHPNVPLSYYIGVLGMPGLSAYFGFLNITSPKQGETVLVSGAAGAVGLLVGQIAKIQGCTVIGIAGSDDKCEYLKTVGYDAVINYKTAKDMSAAIKEAAPNGVDVYFDNVGGPISDAVWPHYRRFARISLCGAISSYNDKEPAVGPRHEFSMISKSIRMEGWLVTQWLDQYPKGLEQMAKWVLEGRIKYTETVRNGLENAHRAFVEMLEGKNLGKMVVKIAD